MVYLGFRIEIANYLLPRNLTKRFNTKFIEAQISDLCREGKIVVERRENMLIAHGQKAGYASGLSNFALLCEISKGPEELKRLVEIMNTLGNERLIKERISFFTSNKSQLVHLQELKPIKNAILTLNEMIPGFIKHGWYYAPEAIFDEE
jgi:hypothetical protein